jgi:hypothetical protein
MACGIGLIDHNLMQTASPLLGGALIGEIVRYWVVGSTGGKRTYLIAVLCVC